MYKNIGAKTSRRDIIWEKKIRGIQEWLVQAP